jgi:hypothetical protein
MRTLMIALMMTLATQAGAEGRDKSFNISGKNFFVLLNDGAVGGCWTNLKEVREYSEEKLRMLRAVVGSGWEKDGFVFEIFVNSERVINNSNFCYGYVEVKVLDMKYWGPPINRTALVSSYGSIVISDPNLNNSVLDLVKKALDEFK